jgi:hypothetical protein
MARLHSDKMDVTVAVTQVFQIQSPLLTNVPLAMLSNGAQQTHRNGPLSNDRM